MQAATRRAMVQGGLTLAMALVVAACYHPKLTNFGFACDSQAPKPCPDGYFCNQGFCDDGAGGTPPGSTGGNGSDDMAMSSGGGGGGGGGGGAGDQDLSMAPQDMAKASPDLAHALPDMVVVSSCAHDECTTGVRLSKTCSACATAVCNKDSTCCTSSSIGWDSLCVSEVNQYCTTKTCP